jgi:hypothetical protein
MRHGHQRVKLVQIVRLQNGIIAGRILQGDDGAKGYVQRSDG